MNEKNPKEPTLSVVVCVVSDAKHLEGCLAALNQQVDAPTIEIIVPYVAEDQEISNLTKQFPHVMFHPVSNIRSFIDPHGGSREHHDELRAIGLGMAKGDILALIEDHGWADKDWARNIVEAHKGPYAAIGGAIENGVDRPLNWAVYYCDFGRYQNPVQPGPTTYISDANISYKRSALEGIKDVWNEAFHETTVNAALMNLGETLWLSPDIVVYQHREELGLILALRERYVWGRSFAGTRAKEISFLNRLVYMGLSPGSS
jgi:hypothetical protein